MSLFQISRATPYFLSKTRDDRKTRPVTVTVDKVAGTYRPLVDPGMSSESEQEETLLDNLALEDETDFEEEIIQEEEEEEQDEDDIVADDVEVDDETQDVAQLQEKVVDEDISETPVDRDEPNTAIINTKEKSPSVNEEPISNKPAKARSKKTTERVPGRSLFPFARVQRLLKLDEVHLEFLLAIVVC